MSENVVTLPPSGELEDRKEAAAFLRNLSEDILEGRVQGMILVCSTSDKNIVTFKRRVSGDIFRIVGGLELMKEKLLHEHFDDIKRGLNL